VIQIVGIVGNVQHDQVTEQPEPEIYVPLSQLPQEMMMLAARTARDPLGYAAAVRAEIQAVDPLQPVYHVKSMQAMIAESLGAQSTGAGLMTLFSGLALVLAAVGIYGVVAYGVTQQRREFGVRLALGAQQRDVLMLVIGSGARLVLAGMTIGALGALAAGRVVSRTLYGVGATDPATFGIVLSTLGLVGLLACCVPAWRASRTEPVSALRVE
jgi:ABC-type antimicrobial peptide transport system permease subunit